MKFTLKLNLILLSLFSIIFFLMAKKIELVDIQQPEIFNLKKASPVFDYAGKYAGKLISTTKSYSREIRDQIIQFGNGKEVRIRALNNVVICKEAKRIVTIGSTHFDHSYGQNPYSIIYDIKGNQIAELPDIVRSYYKYAISKKSEIYISGISKSNYKKRVIVKHNKNGEKEWEVDLPNIVEVKDIEISKDGEKIVITQSGYTQDEKFKSNIIVLNKNGDMLNSISDHWGYSSLAFLGDKRIVLSYSNKFKIKNLKTLEDIIPSTKSFTIEHYSSPLIYGLENERFFVTVDQSNAVKLVEIQEGDIIKLKKKIFIDDSQRFKTISIIDDKTFNIYSQEKWKLFRQTMEF